VGATRKKKKMDSAIVQIGGDSSTVHHLAILLTRELTTTKTMAEMKKNMETKPN
jgi:hypothetical protein